jgi:signal peptidase II
MSENNENKEIVNQISESAVLRTRIMSSILFTSLLVVADQLSKSMIVKEINYLGEKQIIDGFFSLFHTRNTGSAWSFLADKSWGIHVLTGVSIVMSIFIAFIMIKAIIKGHGQFTVILGMLLGGAVGNLVDRLRLGYVVDFLKFKFGDHVFPIFNLADIFCTVSVFLLIFMFIFKSETVDVFLNDIFPKKDKEESK